MITDYSKIINLDEWPPKPEQKKEVEPEKKGHDVPEWAKPFSDTISKTEELIKKMTDQQEAKRNISEPILGKPETEGGISPAVQEYLNNKKNKAMKQERIKIAANEMLISDQQENVTRTVKIMEEILVLWKEQGIKLNDDEINSLIKSTFGDAIIQKIASERSSKLRARQQLEEYTAWVDDIKLAFRLYPGLESLPFSHYAYYEKGKMKIKDGAFEEIADRYTYYITDEKDIELYNRHQKLIDDANILAEELRANTGHVQITSAWLFRFGADGMVHTPNTFMYGK